MPKQERLLAGLLILAGFTGTAGAVNLLAPGTVIDEWLSRFQRAPVDFGAGPGKGHVRTHGGVRPLGAPSGGANTPNGGPLAATQGAFGAPVEWPINGLEMLLLPDGRVLNYGTDQKGVQTGAVLYDVWDPILGTGPESHLVLPETTATDLFCSGLSLMWTNGQALLTGGDLTVNGKRNYANNKTTIFDPVANTVANGQQMQYPRWYPTEVPLPNGDKLILGGYLTKDLDAQGHTQGAWTPEVYNPATGWRSLTGATSNTTDWYYPKAFVTPAGDVIEVKTSGALIRFTTDGVGTTQRYKPVIAAASQIQPTVMFAPGKLLSLRTASVVVIDINGPTPVVTPTANIDQLRQDASGTVLPDGKVLVTGGSSVHNQLAGAAFTAQIWDPATGLWTTGAAAVKPRLYHSNALLLADGTVLTGAGGSPGPVTNLNAEIYYPPYLYATDGSGNPAPRPAILSANVTASGVQNGGQIQFSMDSSDPVSRVTMVRSGSATHATNVEQRFIDLTPTMTQVGSVLTVTVPVNVNVALPGYYLFFAFNSAGTPSVAQQILVRGP